MIDGCEKLGKNRGLCGMHAARVKRNGDPNKVIPHSERNWRYGEEHQSWKDDPTYSAVHRRLRKARGKASNHVCPCGAPAKGWAYTGPRGGEHHPYSTNLDEYTAMCYSCHTVYDKTQLAKWRAEHEEPPLRGESVGGGSLRG